MGRPKITNKEESLEAVKQDGLALEYVPNKLKTTELCLNAVKQNGRALKYVPKNIKTAEVCFEAVKSMIEKVLLNVPEELREEVRSMLASWIADREHGVG